MKTKQILIYLTLILGVYLLIGIDSVYAQSGPSQVWSAIEIFNEDKMDYDRVYDHGDVYNSLVEGMTYNEDTNTLTLTNFKSKEVLLIAQMGEDFKINLVGENEVGYIVVNDAFDHDSCNLNIVGYGSLTVNKEKTDNVAAISIYNGKLIVDDSVTLELFSYEDKEDASNNRPIITIYNTDNKNDLIIFKNGYTPTIATSGQYNAVELNSLTILPIYHIEIENANLTLKVGEEPAFNASIKNNNYNLKLAQTIISTPSRWSTISSEVDPSNDSDNLVKNSKYDYFIEVIVKNSKGNIYDENIQLSVDGVKWTNFRFVSEDTFYIYMKDEITPEGYIEPVELDNSFEEEQKKTVEKIILQEIKAGKVKYKDVLDFTAEGTKEAVQNALNNGDEINVDIYVSETLHESLMGYYFDEDETSGFKNKIGENQKLVTYYYVEIEIFVNGYIVGYISSLEIPIQVTVPFPNGVPKVSDGYQRIWKIIREHEGIIDILDAEKTENGISFESDKFSAYAAIYEDEKIENESQEEIVPTNEDEKTENKNTNNPQTGDDIMLYISMLLISIIGFVGIGIYIRNRKYN